MRMKSNRNLSEVRPGFNMSIVSVFMSCSFRCRLFTLADIQRRLVDSRGCVSLSADIANIMTKAFSVQLNIGLVVV